MAVSLAEQVTEPGRHRCNESEEANQICARVSTKGSVSKVRQITPVERK